MVEGWIRREIVERGPISFERFMELALYAPGVGYYERTLGQTGRGGDFYTSVSVGPVFGFLLAAWIAQVGGGWERFDVVEAGAHDGRLAEDVLGALDRFWPAVAGRVGYRILEPSEARAGVQRARLSRWAERVQWHRGWDEPGLGGGVSGVIFSNELLDAMPVRRWVWDAVEQRWWEAGVTIEGGRLAWCRMDRDGSGLLADLEPLELVLPGGYVVETHEAAEGWWRAAAGAIARGWLLAFDYGYDEDGRILPERTEGTARAYWRHRRCDDLLARPGEQDLTAHVDFPRLIAAGEAAGLRTGAFVQQGRWLGRVATGVLEAGGEAAGWLGERVRGLQTLLHPEHLGQAFRVLAQSRGVGAGEGAGAGGGVGGGVAST